MPAIVRSDNSDLDILLNIEHGCFKACDCLSRTQFQYYMRKGACFTISAIHSYGMARHAITGYFIIKRLRDALRIYSMAICAPYQRIGNATIALQYIEAQARNLGKAKIVLEVRKGNHHAIACYKKNGYFPIAVRYKYYNDGTDAIVMQKDVCNARQMAKGGNTL